MKNWKLKIIFPMILVTILAAVYFVLWHFPVSNGERVGNLTKISKKGNVIKTWEGTIDEGSGEALTSTFSVRDEALARELYNYEGRSIVIYYNEYLIGWPWDTHYDVVSWKSNVSEMAEVTSKSVDEKLVEYMGKTLFCTLLGSLYLDQDLYSRVKEYIQKQNLYLYKQIKTCNE